MMKKSFYTILLSLSILLTVCMSNAQAFRWPFQGESSFNTITIYNILQDDVNGITITPSLSVQIKDSKNNVCWTQTVPADQSGNNNIAINIGGGRACKDVSALVITPNPVTIVNPVSVYGSLTLPVPPFTTGKYTMIITVSQKTAPIFDGFTLKTLGDIQASITGPELKS